MRAGRMDRRVTIRQPVETQSDSGEPVTGWQTLTTVWAEQVNVPGNERYSMAQIVGHALATFRLRYSATTRKLTVKSRLLVDGREYDVTDVRETRRREEIQVDCFARSEQQVATGPNILEGTTWIPVHATLTSTPTMVTLTEDTTNNAHFADNNIAAIQPAGNYIVSFDYKALGPTLRIIAFGIWDGNAVATKGWDIAIFSVADPPGTVAYQQDFPADDFILTNVTVVNAGDGWWTFTARFTVKVAELFYLWFNIKRETPFAAVYPGNGSAIAVRNGRLVMQ